MEIKHPKVGKGHGGNSNLPILRKVLPENMTIEQRHLLKMLQPGTRVFRLGKARIYVSPPTEDAERPGWHLSISCSKRYPNWDEVAKAWYELVPEADRRTAVLFLPPVHEYINIHEFCFQVHELVAVSGPV